jgi:hypothetical protein
VLFDECFSKTIEHSERKCGVEDQVEEEFKTRFHGSGGSATIYWNYHALDWKRQLGPKNATLVKDRFPF